MNYLLDTCAISDFFKKLPVTIDHFQNTSPTQIHISSITVMEIEYGLALNVERASKIRPVWDSLLETVTIIAFCSECANRAALQRAELKTAGLPIGPFDILIAGTALAHDLIVVTSNVQEFKRINELTVEDWRL